MGWLLFHVHGVDARMLDRAVRGLTERCHLTRRSADRQHSPTPRPFSKSADWQCLICCLITFEPHRASISQKGHRGRDSGFTSAAVIAVCSALAGNAAALRSIATVSTARSARGARRWSCPQRAVGWGEREAGPDCFWSQSDVAHLIMGN